MGVYYFMCLHGRLFFYVFTWAIIILCVYMGVYYLMCIHGRLLFDVYAWAFIQGRGGGGGGGDLFEDLRYAWVLAKLHFSLLLRICGHDLFSKYFRIFRRKKSFSEALIRICYV